MHPTLVAWRLWAETCWPLLLNIDSNKGKLAHATVQFSEDLTDHRFRPGVVLQFTAYAGVTVPEAEILRCLGAYHNRKGLIPNLELGMFTPYSPPTTMATPQQRQRHSYCQQKQPTSSRQTPPHHPPRHRDRHIGQRRSHQPTPLPCWGQSPWQRNTFKNSLGCQRKPGWRMTACAKTSCAPSQQLKSINCSTNNYHTPG